MASAEDEAENQAALMRWSEGDILLSLRQQSSNERRRRKHASDDSVKYVSSKSKQQYRKGSVIGRGANGTVYQGMDTRSGSLVAIKEVAAQPDDAAFHKLCCEVQLMSRLSHENIVAYHGAELDETAGVLLIYQEWVAGGSIDALLHKFGGSFPDVVTQRYAIDVARGLAYLHQEKIVHRDIKGGNVLVSDLGVAKLSDFGTSMMLGDSTALVGTKSLCGTPYFMAPEVMKGEKYGRKADVWSFGGLLVQMATGSPPWKSMSFNSVPQLLIHVVTEGKPPPLDSDAISPALKALMMRCFQFDAALRPTAAELLGDAFLQEAELPPAPILSATRSTPRQKQVNPYSRTASRSRANSNRDSSASPSSARGLHKSTIDRRFGSAPSLSSEAVIERYAAISAHHRKRMSSESLAKSVSPRRLRQQQQQQSPPKPASSPRIRAVVSQPSSEIGSPPKLPDMPSRLRTVSSREEDEAFDALVRTLPDDVPTVVTALSTPRKQNQIGRQDSFGSVSSTPRRGTGAGTSSRGSTPPRPPPVAVEGDHDRSNEARSSRERAASSATIDEESFIVGGLISETAESSDDQNTSRQRLVLESEDDDDASTTIEEEKVITIEDAYQKGYLTGKEYQKRMELVRKGDDHAGYFSMVFLPPPLP